MKDSKNDQILILGIGNSSRSDDGLGWWMVDRLIALDLDANIEHRFQLNVEDAELISQYELVLFIDATSVKLPLGYLFYEVTENIEEGTFSHAVSPGRIKYLANSIFEADPGIFMLEISGKDWEIGEGLSSYALENGLNALHHVQKALRDHSGSGRYLFLNSSNSSWIRR